MYSPAVSRTADRRCVIAGIGRCRVYGVFAESIRVHTSDHDAGDIVTVTEVLGHTMCEPGGQASIAMGGSFYLLGGGNTCLSS